MAEGNYLGKRRKNFFLSRDCCQMIVELAYREGLSEGGVIEQAMRRYYKSEIGEFQWSRPVGTKNQKNF